MAQTAQGLTRAAIFHRSGFVHGQTFARVGPDAILEVLYLSNGRLHTYHAFSGISAVHAANGDRWQRHWDSTWYRA